MDKYRHNENTGDVHEWRDSAQAYVYIGNTNGRTLKSFLASLDDDESFCRDDDFDFWQ